MEFQEMGSQDNGEKVTNSFSMREFVLGARQRDIRNNWPFPERYLEVCVKHGVNKLLPPFKSLDYGKYTSLQEPGQSSCAQEDNTSIRLNKENELVKVGTNLCIDDAVSELTRQMSPLSLSSNYEHKQNNNSHQDHCDYAMPSTKILGRKRKKHKRKLKKRSLADIYAETSPLSLEDLADIGGSTSAAAPTVIRYIYAQGTTEGRRIVHEINGSMQTLDQNNGNFPEESFKLKCPRYDDDAESGDSDAYDA